MVPDETGDSFLYLPAFTGSFHQVAHGRDLLVGLFQLIQGEILLNEVKGGHERVTGSAWGQVCLGRFEVVTACGAEGETGFKPGEFALNPGDNGCCVLLSLCGHVTSFVRIIQFDPAESLELVGADDAGGDLGAFEDGLEVGEGLVILVAVVAEHAKGQKALGLAFPVIEAGEGQGALLSVLDGVGRALAFEGNVGQTDELIGRCLGELEVSGHDQGMVQYEGGMGQVGLDPKG